MNKKEFEIILNSPDVIPDYDSHILLMYENEGCITDYYWAVSWEEIIKPKKNMGAVIGWTYIPPTAGYKIVDETIMNDPIEIMLNKLKKEGNLDIITKDELYEINNRILDKMEKCCLHKCIILKGEE